MKSSTTVIDNLRIALGGVRRSARLQWQELRTRPRIRADAKETLSKLRSLKRTLPSGVPVVGILLGEHVGDVVAAEPIVRYARRLKPSAHLVFFTRPAYAEIVEAHPEVDEVVRLGSISEAEVIVESGLLDIALDLHLQGKPCQRYGRSYKKNWGDPAVTTDSYYHRGSLLHAFSESAGLPRLDEAPRMYIPDTVRTKIDALGLPARFVAIHCSSNEDARNWTTPNWNEWVNKLGARYSGAVIELGLTPVVDSKQSHYRGLCGQLTLLETAEVIRRAEIFVGVESGLAHCANAFERPSIILVGKYKDFQNRMPYTGFLHQHAEEMLVRWPEPSPEIPVKEVLERFSTLLKRTA